MRENPDDEQEQFTCFRWIGRKLIRKGSNNAYKRWFEQSTRYGEQREGVAQPKGRQSDERGKWRKRWTNEIVSRIVDERYRDCQWGVDDILVVLVPRQVDHWSKDDRSREGRNVRERKHRVRTGTSGYRSHATNKKSSDIKIIRLAKLQSQHSSTFIQTINQVEY